MESSTANHRLLKCGSNGKRSAKSHLQQIGNEMGCVGFLFLTLGIIKLMNMAAILHHCNCGSGITFRLICQGFEVSNVSQE